MLSSSVNLYSHRAIKGQVYMMLCLWGRQDHFFLFEKSRVVILVVGFVLYFQRYGYVTQDCICSNCFLQ